MPTKTIKTIAFTAIENRFELIGYRWFDGTWKAAVIKKDDGTAQIRVLTSRRGNRDTYGYFEINADGIITASPRGYARDYNGARITVVRHRGLTMFDDDEPEDWTEPDHPAPPDDYCGTCGKPLSRCNAWNNGDHNWQDLL